MLLFHFTSQPINSASDTSMARDERFTLRTNDLSPESIVGFEVVVGLCIRNHPGRQSSKVHPHGPSSSYKYSETQDVRIVI